MKKKYRKPVMIKKMQQHIHGQACGRCTTSGCGQLVAMMS